MIDPDITPPPVEPQRDRRRGAYAVEAIVVLLMVGLAAAGVWSYRDGPPPGPEETTTTTSAPPLVELWPAEGPTRTPEQIAFAANPPTVTVSSATNTLEMDVNGCPAGADCGTDVPEGVMQLGPIGAEGFDVSYPLAGWEFRASFWAGPVQFGGCTGRVRAAVVTPTGPNTWNIRPAGPAGRYTVSLEGGGPEGWAQVWVGVEFSVQGTEPPVHVDLGGPNGTASAPEINWIYVTLQNLAVDTDPAGRVTWTASNGRSGTVVLRAPEFPDGPDCPGDGAVSLQSTEAEARRLLELGPAPFSLEFELTLGGRTHRATATWPDDLDQATGSLKANFSPPLPALQGA